MSRVRRGKGSAERGRRGRRPVVRVGTPDRSLTGLAGLVAVEELVGALGVVGELDRAVGPVKARARGATGGQLLVGLATGQLCGQDCLAGLDRIRADRGSALLTHAPVPASTTAAQLACRFGPGQLAGIEMGLSAVYSRWLGVLPAQLRARLVLTDPTIDLDATDVEVFGHATQRVGWNYAGVKSGRVHLASWAGADLPLAMDLLAGNDDVRPGAPGLLRRALAVLPAAVCGRARVRADAGYFDGALARAAVELGCDFAIAAKRNTAVWRAAAATPDSAWRDAHDMPAAQVAACDYAPAGWTGQAYTIIRRVKISAERISQDPRSRRRRTIPQDQLALALDGTAQHAYAHSFIVTNIPADDGDIAGLEAWFRRRTSIEDRFREGKHGTGLHHLPSGQASINTIWAWGALLAGALTTMLQPLIGQRPDHAARTRTPTLRHQLLTLPGRILRHARGLTVRLATTGNRLLPPALTALRALPRPG